MYANEKELQVALSEWLDQNGMKNKMECREEAMVRPDIGVISEGGQIEFLIEVKLNLADGIKKPSVAANFMRQCHSYHAQYQKPVYLGPIFIHSNLEKDNICYQYFLELAGAFSVGLLFISVKEDGWDSAEFKMSKCPKIVVKKIIKRIKEFSFAEENLNGEMQISTAAQKAGSITELAAILGCSRFAIHKWIKQSGYVDVPQPWLDALKYRKPEWFK